MAYDLSLKYCGNLACNVYLDNDRVNYSRTLGKAYCSPECFDIGKIRAARTALDTGQFRELRRIRRSRTRPLRRRTLEVLAVGGSI